jgi:hypothetical protein
LYPRTSIISSPAAPTDNYDLENSHVLPALIRKTHEAKDGIAKLLVKAV